MKKISSYVQLKKEYESTCNTYSWKAYFRGTSNRIKRTSGQMVQAYRNIADLRFDLLNNEMERGVLTDN